jgi:hypothetical protein
MRKSYCQACSFGRFGVRTRIDIPHTCGGDDLQPDLRQVPDRPDEPDHQNEYQQHIDDGFDLRVDGKNAVDQPQEKPENYQYDDEGDEE